MLIKPCFVLSQFLKDFSAKAPAAKKLRAEIQRAVTTFMTDMAADATYHPAGLPAVDELTLDVYSSWANVNPPNASNSPHVHPGALAGVYYVASGGADTPISFTDPRPPAEYGQGYKWFQFGGKVSITNEPGSLLLFPAWLQHYVSTHRGNQSRVSVSFNVNIPNLGLR